MTTGYGKGRIGKPTFYKQGRLLKTGQLTQYNSELDDGYYQKGIAKAYTILSTGQYAGTTNINLIHYTAATISFAAMTPPNLNPNHCLYLELSTVEKTIISKAV